MVCNTTFNLNPSLEEPQKSINWTRPMLDRFRRAYLKATADHAETFMFEDSEFLVAYARYLIQYLETQL